MVGEVLVEFGGSCSDLAEVVPRRVGEVMVLDVVAEVEVEDVPDADVVVGFLSLDELVVLCEDVDGGRMRSDRGSAGYEDKQEGIGSPEGIDQIVSAEDEDIIEEFLLVDGGLMGEYGPERVEDLDDRIEDVFIPFKLMRQF